MTRRALIGYTGFVGSNLRMDGEFTDFYNSSNFTEIAGETYDEIVCSGISATKWLANQEPEQDWAAIQRLLDVLAQTSAKRFVLISTIDVYPDPAKPLAEDAELESLPNHPYGRHRLRVETWVKERFANHLIVRLPALFGPGLKKNVIYDLLNDNGVDKINPAGIFQWYPIARLSGDIALALDAKLPLVNLVTAPISLKDVVEAFFPKAPVGVAVQPAPAYNLRTRYASLFGKRDEFIMSADEVMAELRSYVESEQSRSVSASR
jgi:dTDP-4-dehydrorhamnose reductase